MSDRNVGVDDKGRIEGIENIYLQGCFRTK